MLKTLKKLKFVVSILQTFILCAGHGTNSVGNMPTTGYCRQV